MYGARHGFRKQAHKVWAWRQIKQLDSQIISAPRTILDDVCAHLPPNSTTAQTLVASTILECAHGGEQAYEELRHAGLKAHRTRNCVEILTAPGPGHLCLFELSPTKRVLAAMNKYAKELIASILDDHARCERDNAELEAKSLFRLLNFCPLEDETRIGFPIEPIPH